MDTENNDNSKTSSAPAELQKAPQPIATTPSEPLRSPQVQPEPSKPKKNKKIVIAIVIILVLVIAVLAYIFINNQDQDSNVSNNVNDSSLSSSQESLDYSEQFNPAVDVEKISKQVEEQFPGTTNKNESRVGGAIMYDTETGSLVGVESQDGWGRFFSFNGSSESQYFFVINQLKTAGFTESSLNQVLINYNSDSVSGTDDKISYLTNSKYTCRVSTFGGDRLYLDCIDNSTVVAQAAESKQFYDAYEEAADEDYGRYIISISETKNAEKYTEYEVANGGISWAGSGANVFFYRTAGENWKFAYGAQAPPECTELTDLDAQKAFSETTCQDGDNYITFGQYNNL